MSSTQLLEHYSVHVSLGAHAAPRVAVAQRLGRVPRPCRCASHRQFAPRASRRRRMPLEVASDHRAESSAPKIPRRKKGSGWRVRRTEPLKRGSQRPPDGLRSGDPVTSRIHRGSTRSGITSLQATLGARYPLSRVLCDDHLSLNSM